jgi:AcrR family transcriptional regulator
VVDPTATSLAPSDATGAEVAAPDGDAPAAPARSKAERTRAAIIDAALRLFYERGYDDTTMRAIATEAGVSVGNAYYYFASKEHLIQGFYDRALQLHRAASEPVLARTGDLTARISGVLHAWVDVMAPFRGFAGKFFRNAAEPTSPLSPFSAESAEARHASISLWKEVLDGGDAKLPRYLTAELPELLWLYSMGMVLFWVHDPSEGNARTRLLIERTAPVVVRAIGLARVPVLRATIADLVGLIDELKSI